MVLTQLVKVPATYRRILKSLKKKNRAVEERIRKSFSFKIINTMIAQSVFALWWLKKKNPSIWKSTYVICRLTLAHHILKKQGIDAFEKSYLTSYFLNRTIEAMVKKKKDVNYLEFMKLYFEVIGRNKEANHIEKLRRVIGSQPQTFQKKMLTKIFNA